MVSYDLIKEVESQPEAFSSSHLYGGITIEDLVGARALPNFISMDGKAHTDQRMTVMPAFNREVLMRHESEIRTRTRDLLAALPVGEPFDWVAEVSTKLTIRKGEKVALWYISANRDESVFENPEEIDFHRSNARRHLSFGFGPHRCVGARLAELQLGILLEETASLGRTLALSGEPVWGGTPFLHIYETLPVTLGG